MSCCLHVNNSISKLSLNDQESHSLHGMSFSSVLPNHFPLFFHSHSGSTRWHIMEYLTDCESLYCFPCHLSCIHQSRHCTVSVASLLFRGPFDILHCPSVILIFNLHLIIPLLSKACFVSLSVSCSHFSL